MDPHPILTLEATYEAMCAQHATVQKQLGTPQRFTGSVPLWTQEEAVTLLRLWVAAYGQLPDRSCCQGQNYLPGLHTVKRLFGRWEEFLAHVEAPVEGTHPVACLACLACAQVFPSPDRRRIRICPQCHRAAEHNDDTSGDWLTGWPLRDTAPDDIADLEWATTLSG